MVKYLHPKKFKPVKTPVLKVVFVLMYFIFVTNAISQPTVQSFTPSLGFVGGQVTLSGSQFSNTNVGNKVYFGGVQAKVTASSPTSITVTIPYGAAYGPISVVANGLTATSSLPFLPTYSGNGESLGQNTFGVETSVNTDYYPQNISFTDLDSDGKPDMLAMRNLPNSTDPSYVIASLNTSIGQSISFASPLITECGTFTNDMLAADFDGDGKIDVATSNVTGNEVSILRNTSATGSLSFAPRVSFSAGEATYNMAAADIDGDGKIDIVVTNYFAGTVTFLRNQSSPGNIQFLSQPGFAAGITPKFVVLADLNNDHKPDLVVANEQMNSFSVYRNMSTGGTFSFTAGNSYNTIDAASPKALAVADLDMDGGNDLIVTTSDNVGSSVGGICVFRNNSQTGAAINISYSTFLPPAGSSGVFTPAVVADVNGDGKPDIVSGRRTPSSVVSVYQNKSVPAAMSFGSPQTFYSMSPTRVCVGDLNSDGRPDIAIADFFGAKVDVWRNRMGQLAITGLSSDKGGEGAEILLTGKRFTGTTAVAFGGIPASSFSIVSDTLLKAVVGKGGSGDITVTGISGTDKVVGFVYDNTPQIFRFDPLMARNTDTVAITGENFLNTSNVNFGGVQAAWFSVKNPRLILALPAVNANNGYIEVQTPGGDAYTDGFIFLTKPEITSFSPTAAYEGQELSIFGKHLALPGSSPQVSLGGVSVADVYVNIDATALYLRVGKAATGQVKVLHAGGADSIAGFTFISGPYIKSFAPTSAYSNDTVFIEGSNFTEASQVFFGDSTAAWFAVASDSLIKAIPGHAQTGVVSISKVTGTGSLPGFTFLPFPSPVIFSFTPGKAISGTWLDVQGRYLWDIMSVIIGGTPVKEYQQLSTSHLRVMVPIGAAGAISIVTDYGQFNLTQPVFQRILPPVILSVVPQASEVGQTISIKGSGFGNDSKAVSLFFGPIKAAVTSVQDDNLTVIVPAYVGYGQLTVTVNNLSSLSPQAFTPLNPATSFRHLEQNSFVPVYPSGQSGTAYDRQTMSIDINGDGKPDFVTVGNYGDLNYYINTSTPAKISYKSIAGPTNITGGWGLNKSDFDGDGKIDIISFGYNSAGVGIARNISTADSIAFEYTLPNIGERAGLLADMNSDGKMDVITQGYYDGQASILFNNSTPGNIIFRDTLPIVRGSTEFSTTIVTVVDLDNDGLLDLIGVASNSTILYRNTGTKQKPLFNEAPIVLKVDGFPYATLLSAQAVVAEDMNGDNRKDLILSFGRSYGSFAVFKNQSSPGVLNFGKFQLKGDVLIGNFFEVADFNGDNRPDLVTGDNSEFSFFENMGIGDSIILGEKRYFGDAPYAACVADIDGDRKQDIVSSAYGLRILRNRLNEPITTKICPDGMVDLAANISGNSYQWQMDAGNGFVNIVNNDQFEGAFNGTLTLKKAPSAWLNYQFRCLVNNSTYSEPYILEFSNEWKGTTNFNWHEPTNWLCGNVPDGNTDVKVSLWMIVELKSNGACRSLFIEPYATFNVMEGVKLNITNK